MHHHPHVLAHLLAGVAAIVIPAYLLVALAFGLPLERAWQALPLLACLLCLRARGWLNWAATLLGLAYLGGELEFARHGDTLSRAGLWLLPALVLLVLSLTTLVYAIEQHGRRHSRPRRPRPIRF